MFGQNNDLLRITSKKDMVIGKSLQSDKNSDIKY